MTHLYAFLRPVLFLLSWLNTQIAMDDGSPIPTSLSGNFDDVCMANIQSNRQYVSGTRETEREGRERCIYKMTSEGYRILITFMSLYLSPTVASLSFLIFSRCRHLFALIFCFGWLIFLWSFYQIHLPKGTSESLANFLQAGAEQTPRRFDTSDSLMNYLQGGGSSVTGSETAVPSSRRYNFSRDISRDFL